MGIWIEDWGSGIGIGCLGCGLGGMRIGIGDRGLGSRIGIGDWRLILGIGIGDRGRKLGLCIGI